MENTVKIWKSNLQGLVEELNGPVYVTATHTRSQTVVEGHNALLTVIFGVAAAGFNAEGRVVELRIRQTPVVAYFEREVKSAAERNAAVLADLKARLVGLGFEVRDGVISQTPAFGGLE